MQKYAAHCRQQPRKHQNCVDRHSDAHASGSQKFKRAKPDSYRTDDSQTDQENF
jgi:hypothetical protein